MLAILRTPPLTTATSSYMNATVSLRDGLKDVPNCPDLVFPIWTYQKIADGKVGADNVAVGDSILLPANLFFESLSFKEQKMLYEMYRDVKSKIDDITPENRREYQDIIQDIIFTTFRSIKLDEKTIAFCNGTIIPYPNLKNVGNEPHHTKEKTFLDHDYRQVTAIAILAKIMVPIWGEFIGKLERIKIKVHQRVQAAYELIEPTLEDDDYERIYQKISNTIHSIVTDVRKAIDKKPQTTASTSFILTHSGVDDHMFESMVLGAIIVKSLAIFGCMTMQTDGNPPDVMVYVYDAVKRGIEARIKNMRDEMKTLPKREIANHDSEDNSSIIDHISQTSSKSIDVPILVMTAVDKWEIDKLLEEYDIPLDVYQSAVNYYATNVFGVNSLCTALMASFIGTRFGGSKCLNYLPPHLYQKIVVIMQIFLIRNNLTDLAALTSSLTSAAPVDGVGSPLRMRIEANYQSEEYDLCKETFKGHLDKPIQVLGKRPGKAKRNVDVDRIDFVNHVKKMIEWLVRYTHTENMAPALWEFSKRETRPIHGSECQFDEFIIQHLCRFYLMFHAKKVTTFGLEAIEA